MQLSSLLIKEFKLLFQNWQLLLVSVLVPILAVVVSLVTNETSVIELNIGYISSESYSRDIEILNDALKDYDSITFNFIEFDDVDSMKKAYDKAEIDNYVYFNDEKNVTIVYDSNSSKSDIANAYFYQAIQRINSDEILAKHIDLVEEIQNAQILSYNADNITSESNTNKINSLVLFGFIWIFLYSTLNNSVTQIQQEKTTKTILYLIKAPIHPAKVLLTKQAAVVFQFLIMIFAYIIFTSIMGIFTLKINIIQIVIWILIVLSVSSLGHTFGLLINNSGIMLIIELILVFPIMLTDTLQTTIFDNWLKIMPTYVAADLMISSLEGQNYSLSSIVYALFTIVICYLISCLIMKKRDAVKMCDVQ